MYFSSCFALRIKQRNAPSFPSTNTKRAKLMKLNYKRTTCILAVVLVFSLLVNVRVLAGTIDALAAPGATFSYTLEDLYKRLNAGTTGAKSVFTEPGSGPGSTMHTLDDLMTAAPAVDAVNAASAADVVSGKTFWGLGTGTAWGPQTGTFSMVGQRATQSSFPPDSKILDGMDSDGIPNGPDTEAADIRLLLNPNSTDTLPNIIGVPSGYHYTIGDVTYTAEVAYPVSISSLVGTPTYDPYTGLPLTASHSYNPSWVNYNSSKGTYYFNTTAPIALRVRSVMTELTLFRVKYGNP
jgi:hypothetical protein